MTLEDQIQSAFNDILYLTETDVRNRTPGASADEGFSIIKMALDRIVAANESERRAFVANLSLQSSRALHSFARSLATRAMRRASQDALKYGLLALLFENQREDYRVTLSKLCMLTRSAERMGVRIEETFARVKHLGEPDTVKLFDEYFRQGERDLRHFGYREVETSDGPCFEQIR